MGNEFNCPKIVRHIYTYSVTDYLGDVLLEGLTEHEADSLIESVRELEFEWVLGYPSRKDAVRAYSYY